MIIFKMSLIAFKKEQDGVDFDLVSKAPFS